MTDYKAGRAEAPDILRQQMGLVRQVVDVLHVPTVELAGYEADDVIATLATRARDRGDDVVIVTGDRDTYQLVEDPHVKVLYNRRGVSDYVLYDEAGIKERTGVTPAEYPAYAALRGDPSDNLPGVLTARKRRVPWGTLFWSALSGLVLLALGLAVTNLVEDLYARAPWLGAIGLALALVAGVALLVVMLREIVGLARLATVESLRQRALSIIESDDRDGGRALIRQLAVLYGGRPGALGVLRLLRQVMAHLAVTGGVGMADSVVQQVIGHGIASRLSARLGEGMVNGLLTARLGLLTIDLVRPLPFHELARPALNDLAATLLRPAEGPAGQVERVLEAQVAVPVARHAALRTRLDQVAPARQLRLGELGEPRQHARADRRAHEGAELLEKLK